MNSFPGRSGPWSRVAGPVGHGAGAAGRPAMDRHGCLVLFPPNVKYFYFRLPARLGTARHLRRSRKGKLSSHKQKYKGRPLSELALSRNNDWRDTN